MGSDFRFDRLFIGGEWVAPLDGGTRPSIDPATGMPWGDVAFGGARDIDRAVAAAKQAFEGPWRNMPPWERAALLRKSADLSATHVAALPDIQTLDKRRSWSASRGVKRHNAQYHNLFALLPYHSGSPTLPI